MIKNSYVIQLISKVSLYEVMILVYEEIRPHEEGGCLRDVRGRVPGILQRLLGVVIGGSCHRVSEIPFK